MNGIERFSRKQKELAEPSPRRPIAAAARAAGHAGSRTRAKSTNWSAGVEWDTRIFEDRRKTIGYVCEVPDLIERRLFALGRAIQQALE